MFRGRNPTLRDECIRLRKHQRLSYSEIATRTGAANGSLSYWLKEYPLSESERHERLAKRVVKPYKARGDESKFSKSVNTAELSRSQKNKIAEAAVLYRLVLNGFEVFGSVFDGDRTDWLIRKPG